MTKDKPPTSQSTLKAYAIFDGGGVLGAALAGALKAAEKHGIEFVGFGGTSAGSIIATLAAAGYSGTEIESILVDTDFTTFLQSAGAPIESFKSLVTRTISGLQSGPCGALRGCLRLRTLKSLLAEGFGVDDGSELKRFLLEKTRLKFPKHDTASEIPFESLAPLKIVASDIRRREPVVFSKHDDPDGYGVLEAVRASTSYPLVFKAVDRNGVRLFVDGGLSSNLPAFLFYDEQQRNRYPAFAFDLTSEPDSLPNQKLDLGGFLRALASTAIDAGDALLRSTLRDIFRIPIPIPERFGVLDFKLDKAGRRELFDLGFKSADKFLGELPLVKRAQRLAVFLEELPKNHPSGITVREQRLQDELRARFGDPKPFVKVLSAIAHEFETYTLATNVRASIMLCTGRLSDAGTPTRIVVYSYGMLDIDTNEPHGDSSLELNEAAGCSGKAWSTGRPSLADLIDAANNPNWGMTDLQHARIPAGRRAMLSVPIWNGVEAGSEPINAGTGTPSMDSIASGDSGNVPIGTLSIDSDAPLGDTGWVDQAFKLQNEVLERLMIWENVIRKLLS